MKEQDYFATNLILTQRVTPLGWWQMELGSVSWTLPLWGAWQLSLIRPSVLRVLGPHTACWHGMHVPI